VLIPSLYPCLLRGCPAALIDLTHTVVGSITKPWERITCIKGKFAGGVVRFQ